MANPTEETFTPDNLLYGDFPMTSKGGTLISGAGAYVRGTVLGLITASQKYTIVASGAADGSENPAAVLLADADSTSADVECVFAESGKFAEDHLVFDGADTIATFRTAMRDVSLFTDKSTPAV